MQSTLSVGTGVTLSTDILHERMSVERCKNVSFDPSPNFRIQPRSTLSSSSPSWYASSVDSSLLSSRLSGARAFCRDSSISSSSALSKFSHVPLPNLRSWPT